MYFMNVDMFSNETYGVFAYLNNFNVYSYEEPALLNHYCTCTCVRVGSS